MLNTIKKHHTTSSVFKQFADYAELVYFGSVKKDDDAHIYKGVTFSATAHDRHYTHGTYNDYDMTVFTREGSYALPGGRSTQTEWTVIAIHLKTGAFPHVILDNHKHDREFYSTVFTRFPRLRRAGSVLRTVNESAARAFDLYMNPDSNIFASNIIDESMVQRIFGAYAQFDLEIDDDMLYVFRRGDPQSVKELKDMLSEAMWVAESIENRAQYLSPALHQN